VDSHLSDDKIPGRIVVLVRDLVRFRTPPSSSKTRHEHTGNRKFLKVLFHSKGIDMVNLPSLLHNKNVITTIPLCINNTHPIVSYQYTNTISSRVLNHKTVVSEIINGLAN
jgi:hypothetical protein